MHRAIAGHGARRRTTACSSTGRCSRVIPIIVPNIAGLRLSAPDGGAVELIVDGTSVGFAGDNGVVANGMPLNPQEFARPAERAVRSMSIRPYRDIVRRKSRKIRVGTVEVGGDAPITVQSMTNTLTSDAKATIAQIEAPGGGGRRHRARVLPGRRVDRGAEGDRQRVARADRRRHPFPLQARHRSGASGRCVPAHQSRQYRLGAAREGSGAGGQGSRLLDAHRRQCRLAGEGSAGEIRRAVPGSDGRERAQPHAQFSRTTISANSRSA